MRYVKCTARLPAAHSSTQYYQTFDNASRDMAPTMMQTAPPGRSSRSASASSARVVAAGSSWHTRQAVTRSALASGRPVASAAACTNASGSRAPLASSAQPQSLRSSPLLQPREAVTGVSQQPAGPAATVAACGKAAGSLAPLASFATHAQCAWAPGVRHTWNSHLLGQHYATTRLATHRSRQTTKPCPCHSRSQEAPKADGGRPLATLL